jgi:Cys-rich four helix bundle protein (predicted Tat secretion target)
MTGRDCLELCIRVLSAGDKMMAECAGTVRQMIPLCDAVAELGRIDGSQLKAVAAACAKACRECEASCRKHADHHAECKACAVSCSACAAECEKFAA